MKKHISKRFIIEAACLILIIGIIVIRINDVPKVDGWTDFKKDALKNFAFVRDVHYQQQIIPPSPFLITFVLKKQIDKNEADAVFEYTRNYLQSKEVVADLVKYNTYKFGRPFSVMQIELFYYQEENSLFYSIRSILENDNSFETWKVEENNMTQ